MKLPLIIVLLAILIRSSQEYLIPDLPTDKVSQITSATHFVEGHGISWAYGDTTDLSKTVYKKIGLWPPGYVLSISPLLLLGLDWLTASIMLELIAIWGLLISLFLILRLMKAHIASHLVVTAFLYLAFTISPFRNLYSTDLLALTFFTLGLYGLIKISLNVDDTRLPYVIGTSFLFFSSSLFHYGYYSVSLAFPLISLIYCLCNSKSVKVPLISFFATLAFIILQICYLKLFTGDSYYLNDYHPGPLNKLHFYNLKKFDPFIFNSFFDAHLVKKVLSKELFFYFKIGVAIVVLYLLFVGPARNVYKSKFSNWNIKQWFFIAATLLVFAKIFLLIALSLVYPPEYNGWSYVQEPRYFAIAYLLIPLSLIVFYDDFSKNAQRLLVGFLGVVLISSLTVSSFLIKKYIGGTPVQNMCRYYHYSEELYYFIKDSRLKENGDKIVFCNAQENNYIYELFLMEGLKMIDFKELPKQINTSKDITMLIAVKNLPDPEVQQFLSRHKSKRLLQIADLKAEIWEICIPKNI